MVAWALAFLVTGATAVGSFVARTLLSRGDGASPGLDSALAAIPGLVLALIAVAISRAQRREAPGRVRLRLGLAGLAGLLAGGLAASAGDVLDPPGPAGAAIWLLLVPGPALLAWPWGARRGPAVAVEPSPETLSRLAWLLPLLLAGGVSCGASIGFTLAAGDALERDPVGSLLAALSLLSMAGAFTASIVSVVVAKALRRSPPQRLGQRVLAGVLLGTLLGVLAWRGSDGSGSGVDLFLLLMVPAALSWSWSPRPRSGAGASALCALALSQVAALAAATPPPQDVTIELGTDSQGRPWRLSAGVEGPLVVFGERRIEVSPPRRLDYLALSGAIDERDRAWIVDASGQGVRVELTSGRFEPIALPVSRSLLVGELAADAGFVYFADADARGRTALARVDVAGKRLARLHEIEAPRSFLAFVVGPRHAWVVSWDGLAGPRQGLHAAAVDKASGQVVRTSSLTVDWAAERWQGLTLDEDPGGNLWIADPYSGQVHRLDATAGTWRSWSFAPRAPTAVVATAGGALVQLVRRRALADQPRPTGAPSHETTGVDLAFVTPGDTPPATLPLEQALWGRTPRGDRSGRVWLGPDQEVRITRGRLELASATRP